MVTSIEEFDAKYWVKVRSSLDATPTFITWSGSIYAFIPNEPKKRLFKIVGMSVSRCLANEDNSWDFTSRELTYYLDPITGEILHKWENPWTGEILPVVHVANNPVQGRFEGTIPAKVDGELTTFSFDLFSSYPNPLAEDDRFIEYSPYPTYQAAELFKLTVPTKDLLDPEQISISKMLMSWDRIGPWVPWMKMGDKAGQLIYSTSGLKVSNFCELPQLLQDEINQRIPLYKDAPKSQLDQGNMTSWKYFKQHFAAYQAGNQFPVMVAEDL
ncbi:MAG: DUF1838 domain-containing protein [Symploca sp. SIO2G7]|nr:DUF1838 domain-containing protein [Symploca sp. SIO2G7]